VRFPLLALLLLPAAAGARPKPRVAATDLPRVRKVEPFPVPSPFETFTVELDAKGGLSVDGTRATLDEVDARLLFVTEQRAIALRRKGEPGMEKLPTGEASPVHVHLRVHKDAPWRHVQWLLTLFAERRVFKTEFVATDGDGKEGLFPAWLPLGAAGDGGLLIDGEEETEKAPPERPGVLTLTLLAEGERDVEYQGKPVRAPGAVAFAAGKRKTSDREKFARMIAEEAHKAKMVEVRVEGRIAVGQVLSVADDARANGLEKIDLYRPVPVPHALRSSPSLPWPEAAQ